MHPSRSQASDRTLTGRTFEQHTQPLNLLVNESTDVYSGPVILAPAGTGLLSSTPSGTVVVL